MIDPLDNEQLNRVWVEVEAYKGRMSVQEVTQLLMSADSNQRLFALLMMRRQMHEHEAESKYLVLARTGMDDLNENCRLQAMIVAGEFIGDMPDEIWDIIAVYGRSDDLDIRVGVATVLLEPMIHRYPHEYVERIDLLAGLSPEFAQTYHFAKTGVVTSTEEPQGL